MHESDLWIEADSRPKKFYYDQQRLLADTTEEDDGKWMWVVMYPQDIPGVARGNFINLATAPGRMRVYPPSLGMVKSPFRVRERRI